MVRLSLFLAGTQFMVWGQAQTGADDPEVQRLYAEAKAAQASGNTADAIAKYQEMLTISPRLAAAYNNLGLIYFKQRDYANAAAILEKGLKIDPSMSSSRALLGISLYEMGKYTEARGALEEAVRSNPSDANAQLFLANDLVKLEEYEAAATRLLELSRSRPSDQEVWYLLGKVYMQLSEQALSKMSSIDPNSALAHETSGEIMEAMKNYDGAIVEYKKAVELAPHRAGSHYELGNAYWVLSQWDTAAEQFEAELANDPFNCMAQWKIGNIMLDRNQEALPELQAAVKANPDEATIHFLLAQTYRALGRTQEAQAELQIFSKLDEGARAATAERAQQVIQNKESTH
jgi:tetratricopeptide (TPR) repeat protein